MNHFFRVRLRALAKDTYSIYKLYKGNILSPTELLTTAEGLIPVANFGNTVTNLFVYLFSRFHFSFQLDCPGDDPRLPERAGVSLRQREDEGLREERESQRPTVGHLYFLWKTGHFRLLKKLLLMSEKKTPKPVDDDVQVIARKVLSAQNGLPLY